MALMACPECGHSMSSQAVACPSCGSPRQAPSQATSVVVKAPSDHLVAVGYICALLSLVLFPYVLGLAAVIIGVINMTKGRPGHGIGQILVAAGCVGINVFVGGISARMNADFDTLMHSTD